MKIELGNLPVEAHRRYAIDEQLKKNNPLPEMLKGSGNFAHGAPLYVSTVSVSHLSTLLRIDGARTGAFAFFDPPSEANPAYLFSSLFFNRLEPALERFSKNLPFGKNEKSTETAALKAFFSLIKQLRDMSIFIQSQRIGIQQG